MAGQVPESVALLVSSGLSRLSTNENLFLYKKKNFGHWSEREGSLSCRPLFLGVRSCVLRPDLMKVDGSFIRIK